MYRATQALTVIAELDPGPTPRALLEHRLAAIAGELEANSIFRPGALPDTHFMRLVIVDDERGELPSLLAWESNHDGRAADYLAAVAHAAPGIDAVFACCAGYPAAGVRDVDAWVAWMLERSRRANAFYAGYRGIPHQAIVNDHRVHDAIRDVLDGEDRIALCGLPRTEIQRRICEQVAARHPDLDLSPEGPEGDDEPRWLIAKILAMALAAIVLVIGLPFALFWYSVLRRKESTEFSSAYVRPVQVDRAVKAAEDRMAQNQLTHLVDIKPGAFRLTTLRFVLWALDIAAQVYSVRGDLGGITAIHFARWVILYDERPRGEGPRRHRLLFFSNYDGSWESYLGEFIDRAAYGLTAVWSNTVGFPATENLVFGGARDEDAFKQWTREHQVLTQVWWSGAGGATVQNIRDNVWIRRRLDRGMGDDELMTWLRKL